MRSPLYGCESAKLLSTFAENCSQSASFGTISTLSEKTSLLLFSFDDLCCARDCSQLSRIKCCLFCVMQEVFPRTLRGRIDAFLLVEGCSSSCCFHDPALLQSGGSRPLGLAGRAACAHGRRARVRQADRLKGGEGRGGGPEDLWPGPQARQASRQTITLQRLVFSSFFSLGVFPLRVSFYIVWQPHYASSFLLHVFRRGECTQREALEPFSLFASFFH